MLKKHINQISYKIIGMLLSENIRDFLKNIGPYQHIGLFYDTLEGKHSILFDYLSEGLNDGKGIVYVCHEETPDEIRRGMSSFGIDVEPNEKAGNLVIHNGHEWYMLGDTIEPLRIINQWNELYQRFHKKGLGMRVTGEVTGFFNEDRVSDLLRYEYALHKILTIPMEALCSYNVNTIVKKGYSKMIMPLVKAHGMAIFTAQDNQMILEPEKTEGSDIENLLKIQI